jgi:hypothetical protein
LIAPGIGKLALSFGFLSCTSSFGIAVAVVAGSAVVVGAAGVLVVLTIPGMATLFFPKCPGPSFPGFKRLKKVAVGLSNASVSNPAPAY